MTEDEMVGWYYQLNRHEFEETLGDSEGQGSLACCSSWGLKESNMTVTAAAAAKSLQSCLTLCDPRDGSPPGSPSLGFSRQEHWSGLPFPSPMHESEK